MLTKEEKRDDERNRPTNQYKVIKDTKKRENTHNNTQQGLHIPGEKRSNCQTVLANWQEG